jgi:hypothetical protein
MSLRLQDLDGTAQCINRLAVVLVRGVVVRFLDRADLCGSFDVAVPDRDVFVVSRDLLCELGGISRVLLDISCYLINFIVCLGDGARLLGLCVIAELLVSRKLDRLSLLFLLALRGHAFQ